MGIGLLLVLGVLAAAGWMLGRWTDVPLLLPEGNAEWIRSDASPPMAARRAAWSTAFFQAGFRTDAVPHTAILTVRAMKNAAVLLDGRIVLPFRKGSESWKSSRTVDLARYLSPGEHRLTVAVSNWNGPVLLLARCDELGLATGKTWTAREESGGWRQAIPAGETPPLPETRNYLSSAAAFFEVLPILAPLFLLVFGLSLAAEYGKGRISWLPLAAPRSSHIRWAMLAAWVAMGWNNITRFPPGIGFDVDGHFLYIKYLLDNHRLPLATDGWVTYHAPLYYVLSALLFSLWRFFTAQSTAMWMLRIVPLLCGALQIEVSFRAMRRLFPDREDLQSLGVVVAGLIPMNIYMSQSISNEPMAALLTSVAVLLCFGILVPKDGDRPFRSLVLLGITLGAALLTKVSALFLLPVAAAAVAWGLHSRGWALRRIAGGVALFLGIAVLLSGWFYVRNAVLLGKPFVANWDPESGKAWWQGPGFRTPVQLLAFGESLVRPVFSGIYRFWDAIYSTFWLDGFLSGLTPAGGEIPWNWRLMISGAWLGLVPTMAMISGAAGTVLRPRRQGAGALFFSIAAAAAYFGALFLMATTTPFYSTGKAFYALGLLPCFGALAAAGFEPLMGRTWTRALTWGLVACWAVASYAAYFIVR